jgi:hypothetical protein
MPLYLWGILWLQLQLLSPQWTGAYPSIILQSGWDGKHPFRWKSVFTDLLTFRISVSNLGLMTFLSLKHTTCILNSILLQASQCSASNCWLFSRGIDDSSRHHLPRRLCPHERPRRLSQKRSSSGHNSQVFNTSLGSHGSFHTKDAIRNILRHSRSIVHCHYHISWNAPSRLLKEDYCRCHSHWLTLGCRPRHKISSDVVL